MRHWSQLARVICMSVCTLLGLVVTSPAQQDGSQATTTCNFDPQKQLALEYQQVTFNPKKPLFGHQVPYNKVWAPGGKPMTLFANAPVAVGNTTLPAGAYTLFLIPSEKHWMLVISKSTDMSGKYQPQDDLVRVPMDEAQLPSPQDALNAVFGHIAPSECNLRVYLDKSAVWVGFTEK